MERVLNWIFGVTFGEDQSRAPAGNTAQDRNILRHSIREVQHQGNRMNAGRDHACLLAVQCECDGIQSAMRRDPTKVFVAWKTAVPLECVP